MNISFFETEGWEEKIVREQLPRENLFFSTEKIDELHPPTAGNDCEILSVFVNSRITEKTLAHFPSMKFLTTRSTGFDHVDPAACKKRGIHVAYVPGYGNHTVAEFAFGLILNLTRKLYQSIDQIKEAESFSLKGLRGIDLKNRTIGIIGTGRIGREAITIAKGFGMKVLAYDAFPDTAFAKNAGISYVPLDDLLKNSDIVSIHAPYTKETRHLIDQKNIRLMKRGSYLVNTARGGIVETDALVMALQDGILAGAGMDVLEEEGETKDEMTFLREGNMQEQKLKTMLENHILMKMPNVLITPHNAFNTQEALERILGTTLESITGYLAGKPVNLIPYA